MTVTELDGGSGQGEPRNLFGFPSGNASNGETDRPARIRHFEALTQTIEGEIIPRLLLVYGNVEVVAESASSYRPISDHDVTLFSDMVVQFSHRECIGHVARLHDEGAPLQTLFLDLLAPTARRLGQLWTEDLRSFTDVTIGLGVLQQVFRHFCPSFEAGTIGRRDRRAFLVPAPGEQHTFGLFVLETFLHRAGWDVSALPAYDAGEVAGFLRSNDVQLICVSASCDRFIDRTRKAIAQMRAASVNRHVVIMAGGSPFNLTPQLVRDVGADASACDAHEAVQRADALVPLPAGDSPRSRIN